MTTYDLDAAKRLDARFAALLAQAPAIDRDSIRIALLGPVLVIEGSVATYDLKCRIERAARLAGFDSIQNCLRVVPGNPSTSDAILPNVSPPR